MKKCIVFALAIFLLFVLSGCMPVLQALLSEDETSEPSSYETLATTKPTEATQPTEPPIPEYIEVTLEDELSFYRVEVIESPKSGESVWKIKGNYDYTLTVTAENGKVVSVVTEEGLVLYDNGEVVITIEDYEEQEYKKQCEKISYEDLARNPDKYSYDDFTFTGEVIQVMDDGYDTILRINVTSYKVGDSVFYKDTIYAEVRIDKGADRILEDDIITVWGYCTGLETYESIFGQQISIPGFRIEYYEIK